MLKKVKVYSALSLVLSLSAIAFAFITIMVLYPSSSVALTTLLSMALLVLQ